MIPGATINIKFEHPEDRKGFKIQDAPEGLENLGRSRLTSSRRSHHHAKREFLLEHRLDEHHVEVADDGAVDDHDLVALDDPCKQLRIVINFASVVGQRQSFIPQDPKAGGSNPARCWAFSSFFLFFLRM